MGEIRKVALLGGGVIGAGWAARLAMNGIDSVICDPDPEVERKTSEVLANARAAYRKLTLAPLNRIGNVSFTRSVEEAVADADFIQESAPERLELKTKLLAQASKAARPDTIIASSTSGLLPSDFQKDCAHPERVCVGHPFNPVYLLPLVEIVGGKLTSEETKQRAAAFYERIGMHPLICRKEIDAFISDRLQEAVWRESLHMVNEGVATADEIDQSICYGPGLRWSFMGIFLIYRMAGGEAGMRHFMEQFGPALKLPWTKLEAPELTEELIEKVASQSDEQAAGRSIRELERLRDDCLVSVMQALRARDFAAGAVLKRQEERFYQVSHAQVLGDDETPAAPLALHATRVFPEWVDYNGHLTESRYLQVFGDSSDALFRYIGIDADYHAAGFSYYTVETHLRHVREVAAEEPIAVTTQIIGADEKRIHLFHTMTHETEGTLLATAEQMLLHVDAKAGRACPARPEILARVRRIAEAHAGMALPEAAGRKIGMPATV